MEKGSDRRFIFRSKVLNVHSKALNGGLKVLNGGSIVSNEKCFQYLSLFPAFFEGFPSLLPPFSVRRVVSING